MNSFDLKFFQKYTPEWQNIQHIVHAHPIIILGRLILWLFLWVFIPVFFYYYSFRLKGFIPFYFLEWWLLIIYTKIVYDIFDWYNDVWIITDAWVIDLDWSLLRTNMSTIDFENMEWMEVEQNSIFDKILSKWDLIIHKIWDDWFVLPNCINPYAALNQVEWIKNHIEDLEEHEDDGQIDRFDMIMDSLGWVVENYLKTNNNPEVKIDPEELAKAEKLKKYQKSKNSIDLR